MMLRFVLQELGLLMLASRVETLTVRTRRALAVAPRAWRGRDGRPPGTLGNPLGSPLGSSAARQLGSSEVDTHPHRLAALGTLGTLGTLGNSAALGSHSAARQPYSAALGSSAARALVCALSEGR